MQLKDRSMDVNIAPTLQAAYDEQYTDDSAPWRELCARYKADNIEAVCSGKKFQRVLECGAGEGAILSFLNGDKFCSELTALEISDSGLHHIRKRQIPALREAAKFDGYNIPY